MHSEKKQHRVFLIGFGLIILVIVWFLAKPSFFEKLEGGTQKDEQKINEEILKAPSITSDDLLTKIQNRSKIFIIDISPQDDFRNGHIASAVNAAKQNVDRDFLESIGANHGGEIYIINKGEDVAEMAAVVNSVISFGFANTKYLRGGISDWGAKGYPLVSSGNADVDQAKVKILSIDEIKKLAESDALMLQFVDLRDSASFDEEHIYGALNIPLPEVEAKNSEISAVKKVIVYGANESESFQAAVALFDLNHFNVFQMQGSIDDWKNSGGKTESGL